VTTLVDTILAVGDLEPAMQASLGVLGDLAQRGFALAGHGDDVSAELGSDASARELTRPASIESLTGQESTKPAAVPIATQDWRAPRDFASHASTMGSHGGGEIDIVGLGAACSTRYATPPVCGPATYPCLAMRLREFQGPLESSRRSFCLPAAYAQR
jgi:hypothetical protein